MRCATQQQLSADTASHTVTTFTGVYTTRSDNDLADSDADGFDRSSETQHSSQHVTAHLRPSAGPV